MADLGFKAISGVYTKTPGMPVGTKMAGLAPVETASQRSWC